MCANKLIVITLAICIMFLIERSTLTLASVVSLEASSNSQPSMLRKWFYGIPRVLDWSNYGLAVGTSAGYVLVFDERGDLAWTRKVNYTDVWSISWSREGELAVATLGPPGVVYVFDRSGNLIWAVEWEFSQAYSALWIDDALAVAGPGLLFFNKSGGLLWRFGRGALCISRYRDFIATCACTHEWGLFVLDKYGSLKWSYSEFFHLVSWSSSGLLAAAEKYKGVVCVFDQEGNLLWRRDGVASEIGSLAWLGDYLVVGTNTGIFVFDKSGNIKWQRDVDYVEAISCKDGLLAIGSYSGYIVVFDEKGNLKWWYWTCGYIWGIKWYNDLLAAASSDGYVHVLNNGALVWKQKIGFHVESVSLYGGLIAVGGWDINVTVLDFNGNVVWMRETGWVKSLAWHDGLLAVGGYDWSFVFDKDGNLKWRFWSGKVRSLSWSDKGLLAIGSTKEKEGVNVLWVFNAEGKLLWSYLFPSYPWWILSASWSKDGLLAIAVAENGIFVFDENGALKWKFRSVKGEDAPIPWWVSACWWDDLLIVSTDCIYALDKNGKLVWSYGGICGKVFPNNELVAIASGCRVYVLNRHGELKWMYGPPEVIESPKYYYTMQWPENIGPLCWLDGYLVIGDRRGRLFFFNSTTGNLVWVYNMGGFVTSIDKIDGIFVAGGDGGIIVGSIFNVIVEELRRESSKLKGQISELISRLNELQANLSKLKEDYESLKASYEALVFNYTILKSEHDRLKVEFAALLSNYTALLSKYNTLRSTHDELKAIFESLQASCASLQRDYDSLKADYNKLKADYDGLKGIYETLVREYRSMSERLSINTNLMYAFVATSIAFLATTIYFAKRKLRTV